MASDSKDVYTRSAENLNGLCGQQVSISLGNEDKQYFCFCWGVCRDRFVMTQIPVDTDIQAKLAAGSPAIIRFVESGMVCGFKTRIHKVLTLPFRLIFFEYPGSIEMANLRNFKRVSVSLQAEIQWNNENYEGTIRDLSEGGCFFEMKYWQDEAFKDLAVGSTFPIKFAIHGDKTPTELPCRAVRVIRDQEELRMGLSFDDSSQEGKKKISGFVSYISNLMNNGGPS